MPQSVRPVVCLPACLWQGKRTYDAVEKFDTYRNLQRHCAVLSAIAGLSFYPLHIFTDEYISQVFFFGNRTQTITVYGRSYRQAVIIRVIFNG